MDPIMAFMGEVCWEDGEEHHEVGMVRVWGAQKTTTPTGRHGSSLCAGLASKGPTASPWPARRPPPMYGRHRGGFLYKGGREMQLLYVVCVVLMLEYLGTRVLADTAFVEEVSVGTEGTEAFPASVMFTPPLQHTSYMSVASDNVVVDLEVWINRGTTLGNAVMSTFHGDVPLHESVNSFCAMHNVPRGPCSFVHDTCADIMAKARSKRVMPPPPPPFDASASFKLDLPVINVVSFPRSGHHMMIMLLRSIFEASGQHWNYCERYQPNHKCGDEHNIRKSHDFDLTLTVTPGQTYVVMVRRDRFRQLESYYRFNCKQEANQPYPAHCDVPVREFFDTTRVYYQLFRNKWYHLAEQNPGQVKLIFYEDLIMAPLNGTAGVLSFLAHRGSAPTQASAPAPLSSLAVASAAAAWGGVDSAAVWDLRAAAALVRAANICDPHTAEWYKLRYSELGQRYNAEGGMRMFWDVPGSAYSAPEYTNDKYETFDAFTYFVDVPERVLHRSGRGSASNNPPPLLPESV